MYDFNIIKEKYYVLRQKRIELLSLYQDSNNFTSLSINCEFVLQNSNGINVKMNVIDSRGDDYPETSIHYYCNVCAIRTVNWVRVFAWYFSTIGDMNYFADAFFR